MRGSPTWIRNQRTSDARGRTYPALALLCAAIAAVLTGARSLIAISQRITDAPQQVLDVLDFRLDPSGLPPVPYAATARRLLDRVDAEVRERPCRPEPRPHGRRRGIGQRGRSSRSTARWCAARGPGQPRQPVAAPAPCPGPWPPCATSPSSSCARPAGPASRPPSATTTGTYRALGLTWRTRTDLAHALTLSRYRGRQRCRPEPPRPRCGPECAPESWPIASSTGRPVPCGAGGH